MDNRRGLLRAYLLDRDGGGKRIYWDEINSWHSEQGMLWLHLDYTNHHSIEWLTTESGLDPLIINAMIVEETRPRLVADNSGLFIVLRGVNLNPGEEPEDMISIRVWIDEHRIITLRKRRSLAIDNIEKAIARGDSPQSPGEFLILLNQLLVKNMNSVHELIDDQVDELEELVLTGESSTIRPLLADIRRQSISIRRYLSPQREALDKLYFAKVPLLTDMDRKHLREDTDKITRYIEGLDSARERAAITQEELTSRLSEQMEERMYMLSVVAAIFLPLTFFTGLLGINVSGIPGANNEWAFIFVCVFLGLISCLQLWFMRRQKWV